MKLRDKVSIAFKDVLNRKFRSFLTIIAISVGSLLLVAMMGLGDGIVNQYKKLIESFGVTNEISIYSDPAAMMEMFGMPSGDGSNAGMALDTGEDNKSEVDPLTSASVEVKNINDQDLDKILKIDGVDYVRATVSTKVSSVKIGNGEFIDKNITVQGINLKYGNDFSKDLISGKSFTGDKNEILVGESYLKRLKIEDNEQVIGNKIIIKLEYPEVNGIKIKEPKEIEGTIVGVVKEKTAYSNNIIMSSEKLEEIQEYYTGIKNYVSKNGYESVIAVSKDGYNVSKVSEKIMSETGFMTFSMDMLNGILDVMGGIIKSILSIAGIIVLVVAALGLVNTMTMTLQEKRKMIGVMRSVGASRGNIRLIFIFQSMILGISGGILGAVLSTVGIYFINEFVIKSDTFVIALTAKNVGISIGITFLISIIAGLIPSSRAAKLNVVEAVAEE